MGSEAQCTVQFGKQRSEGTAQLETDHLLFRGAFRLKIPHKAITTLDADRTTLRVTFPEGTALFELGPAAAKWADKIRNPTSLLDKLGVKPGMRVAVLGIDDESFLEQLTARTTEVARRTPKKDTEIIFFGADSVADLVRQRHHLFGRHRACPPLNRSSARASRSAAASRRPARTASA